MNSIWMHAVTRKLIQLISEFCLSASENFIWNNADIYLFFPVLCTGPTSWKLFMAKYIIFYHYIVIQRAQGYICTPSSSKSAAYPLQSPLWFQKRFESAFPFLFQFPLLPFLFCSAMFSPSSIIFINRNILVYYIQLLNDKKFLDKFNLSNVDLKDFLKRVFGARCEAVIKFAEIGREKSRQFDSCAMSMSQFWSVFTKMCGLGWRSWGPSK